MSRSIRWRVDFGNVAVVLVLLLVLASGTALAAYVAGSINGDDVAVGSLGLADLDAGSRPHELEFWKAAFHRAEGQVVYQTPGRVTTLNFHAFAFGPDSPRCEFFAPE